MGNNLGYPDQCFFRDYRNKSLVLTFPMMNSVIGKNSIDGYLSLENFNECLKSLFGVQNFPQLAYTHLSERLFNLLDSKNQGKIQCESLMKGICLALSTPETRLNSKQK